MTRMKREAAKRGGVVVVADGDRALNGLRFWPPFRLSMGKRGSQRERYGRDLRRGFALLGGRS